MHFFTFYCGFLRFFDYKIFFIIAIISDKITVVNIIFVVLIKVDFILLSGAIISIIACNIAHTEMVEIKLENIKLSHPPRPNT